MGRTILVEDSVEAYIEKLVKANKWFTGVIFGQQSSQRDYVIHIARTPDPVEDEASEENGEEEAGDGLNKHRQYLERPASLDQLDEKWVSTHAKQVSRMLPGGLSVIGLFVLAPTSMLQANQAKSKQMLFSVHKSLSKNRIQTPSSEINDRILLQIDSTTRKMTCVTFDVSDSRSTSKPADWKYQSSGTKWVRLDSHMNLDIHFAVPKDDKAQNLMKQLQSGLVDFGKSLQQSIIAVDGAVRDGDEPIIAPDKAKGKGGKDKDKGESSKPTTSKVQIFLPYPETPTDSDPITTESQAVIKIFGKIVVRAFVTAKATVADAVEAVRTDVMRSLLARYELLFEEFDVTDENGYNQVYDPPVRLFCSLPNSGIDVCDYSFQDEKKEEVVDRIQELLDLAVDQLQEVEKSAGEDRSWSHQSSLTCISSTHSLASSEENSPDSSLKNYLGMAIGGLVAFVAGGISYLYMND